jgi:hypothetical protein
MLCLYIPSPGVLYLPQDAAAAVPLMVRTGSPVVVHSILQDSGNDIIQIVISKM